MYDVTALLDEVKTHASETGQFEAVAGYEPISAPNAGIHCGVWVQRIDPLPTASGLNVTTGRLLFFVRLYYNITSTEPRDRVDIDLINATTLLMGEYSGDFGLGGRVRNVDLLGEFGESLSSEAGYLEFDDGLFRTMTITLPLIINDLWDQEA